MQHTHHNDCPKSILTFLPNIPMQTAYFLTGSFAGLCTLPIEYTFKLISSGTPRTASASFLRQRLPSGLYRPAIRFWIFSLARSILQHHFPAPASTPATTTPTPLIPHLQTALIGGLSGACGGFSEVLAESLLGAQRRLPALSALGNQSSKLFLCFGTYTFLSSRYSEELPPRPFWRCWGMGAVAGAIGSAVLAGVEGVRGARALSLAAGKGACVIGTVISVQVTSCRAVQDWLGEP